MKLIWKFISKIKQEETAAALKYLRIENNTLKERGRNKADLSRDLEIANLKCKYLGDEINLTIYFESVSKIIQNFSKLI